MIRIISSRKLAALRAEAALVSGLRAAAEQADRGRQEAQAGRLSAEASTAAADAARQQAEARLAALASVPRPAAETAEPPARQTSPRPAVLSRREAVRGHLDRILAAPAPANHADHLRGQRRDHAAASRQIDQVRILQMLYSNEDVAAVYCQWLDEALAEQAKTAERLRSWDETAVDSAPIGWNADWHGFLCPCCGEAEWRIVSAKDAERLCTRCARRELGLEPGQVWAPRLPPAHAHIAWPGGEREHTITATLADGGKRDYAAGDASMLLASHSWMGLEAAGDLAGAADRPRFEFTGSTGREGHRFSFTATLDYDPAPQGTRQTPYGFRYTAGTLTGNGETRAFTDLFDLLDTISSGEAALTPGNTRERLPL